MTSQTTTYQFGMHPPREATETPLSPVAITSPRDEGRTAAGTSFHQQTRAYTSNWVGGTPGPLNYHPSNVASAGPHHTPPSNYKWQSQQRTERQFLNGAMQSPTLPYSRPNLHPMSPATPTIGNNTDHTAAGTRADVKLDTINLPPLASLLRATAATMPPYPSTFTKIPVTADGKRYLCACGHLTKTIGDMARHHEGLKHSEALHICGCGKTYTRKDSLARHEKKCPEKTQRDDEQDDEQH